MPGARYRTEPRGCVPAPVNASEKHNLPPDVGPNIRALQVRRLPLLYKRDRRAMQWRLHSERVFLVQPAEPSRRPSWGLERHGRAGLQLLDATVSGLQGEHVTRSGSRLVWDRLGLADLGGRRTRPGHADHQMEQRRLPGRARRSYRRRMVRHFSQLIFNFTIHLSTRCDLDSFSLENDQRE